MNAFWKGVIKAVLWFLNVVLGYATLMAFGAVGQVLLGLVVMLVMTLAIGYVVADLL